MSELSVARAGQPEFEAATHVFNLAAPVSPAAAVTVRTVEEIRSAIRYAQAERLGVRMITTGHAAGSARPMDGSLLVRTELAAPVEVDSARRVARIPAGNTWGAVAEATAPHGLAAPHGSAGTVGVVGYLLRGGISFYGRKVGLAANSVRAVELVTADGELRRADASTDPELLWALRGGGGGFGVVTAIEVDLFPATQVITGAAIWPIAHAAELLSRWEKWASGAPWEASTSLRVLRLPDVPEVPPELRAGPVLCVDGAILGDQDDISVTERQAEELLEPLRAVAAPVMDTWQLTTPGAVLATHMDPDEPVPAHGDHMLLTELGPDGAAEFLRVVGEGVDTPLVVAGLRQLGGALSEPDPDGGVLNHLDAAYVYSGAGIPIDAELSARIGESFATVRAALGPWDTGRTAPTFVESVSQPQGHLSDEQVRDLDGIRARVDPAGLFRGDIMPNATVVIS